MLQTEQKVYVHTCLNIHIFLKIKYLQSDCHVPVNTQNVLHTYRIQLFEQHPKCA